MIRRRRRQGAIEEAQGAAEAPTAKRGAETAARDGGRSRWRRRRPYDGKRAKLASSSSNWGNGPRSYRSLGRILQPAATHGGSGGRGASACVLPEAAAVPRVECDGSTTAAWLRHNVFSRREPAVLRGLRLGPCVGEWTQNASHAQSALRRQ